MLFLKCQLQSCSNSQQSDILGNAWKMIRVKTIPDFDISFVVSLGQACVCVCVCVCLFRAAPEAYGSSQARRAMGAVAASLCQRGIRAVSGTYTSAHVNPRSLTHWSRPGIKPVSSRMLVGFVNCWAMKGTPGKLLKLAAHILLFQIGIVSTLQIMAHSYNTMTSFCYHKWF